MWFTEIWLFIHSFSNLLCNIGDYSIGYFSYIILMMQIIQLFWLVSTNNFYYDSDIWYLVILIPLFFYNKTVLNLLFIIMSVIILKNYSINRVLLGCFRVQLLVFVVYLLLFFSGVINDSILFGVKGNVHTLGFTNTNVASRFFSITIIITSLMMNKKNAVMKKFVNLILFGLAIWVYVLTRSRTFFLASILYFIFTLIKSEKYVLGFLKTFPIFVYIILIISVKMYIKYPVLDLLFSFRVSILDNYLNELNFMNYIVGYPIDVEKPFDCAYFYLLFSGGLLGIWYFLSQYYYWIRKSCFIYIQFFSPYIVFFLISGVTESTFSMFGLATVLFFRILIEPKTDFFKYNNKITINEVFHD